MADSRKRKRCDAQTHHCLLADLIASEECDRLHWEEQEDIERRMKKIDGDQVLELEPLFCPRTGFVFPKFLSGEFCLPVVTTSMLEEHLKQRLDGVVSQKVSTIKDRGVHSEVVSQKVLALLNDRANSEVFLAGGCLLKALQINVKDHNDYFHAYRSSTIPGLTLFLYLTQERCPYDDLWLEKVFRCNGCGFLKKKTQWQAQFGSLDPMVVHEIGSYLDPWQSAVDAWNGQDLDLWAQTKQAYRYSVEKLQTVARNVPRTKEEAASFYPFEKCGMALYPKRRAKGRWVTTPRHNGAPFQVVNERIVATLMPKGTIQADWAGEGTPGRQRIVPIHKIQIIQVQDAKTPGEILAKFDLGCCQMAYRNHQVWVNGEEFCQWTVNGISTVQNVACGYRMEKYGERGFQFRIPEATPFFRGSADIVKK